MRNYGLQADIWTKYVRGVATQPRFSIYLINKSHSIYFILVIEVNHWFFPFALNKWTFISRDSNMSGYMNRLAFLKTTKSHVAFMMYCFSLMMVLLFYWIVKLVCRLWFPNGCFSSQCSKQSISPLRKICDIIVYWKVELCKSHVWFDSWNWIMQMMC